MNFKARIIERHADEESPIGDLANDIRDDESFTKKNSFSGIDCYLNAHSACSQCHEAFRQAWDEYGKWRKNRD